MVLYLVKFQNKKIETRGGQENKIIGISQEALIGIVSGQTASVRCITAAGTFGVNEGTN